MSASENADMRIVLLLFLSVAVMQLHAQDKYRLLSFTVAGGIGTGNASSAISLEPGLRVAQKIVTGFKIGSSFGPMKYIDSKLFTLQYDCWQLNDTRIWAGVGAGWYFISPHGDCDPGPNLNTNTIRSQTAPMGTMLRTGIISKHLFFSAEYNFSPSTNVNNLGTDGKVVSTNMYGSQFAVFSVGVQIGGGKKNRK